MSHENYVSLTPRLMKSFDSAISHVKPVLIARYGEAEADALMRESRQKYHDLLPQIPYSRNQRVRTIRSGAAAYPARWLKRNTLTSWAKPGLWMPISNRTWNCSRNRTRMVR